MLTPCDWISYVKTPKQLAHREIIGGGCGIHWPELDEELSTEGLLRGAPAASIAGAEEQFVGSAAAKSD